MSLKVSQKFLVAVAVPVVFELVLVGTLIFLLSQADEAKRRESLSRDIASHAYKIMGLHIQRLTQLMIYKSTEDPAMLDKAAATSAQIRLEAANTLQLTKSNPRGFESWKKLESLVRQLGSEHEQGLERLKAGDKTGFALIYAPMRRHFDDLMRTCDELTAQPTQTDGLDVSKYSEAIRYVLYLSVVLSLIIAFCLAYFFNQGTSNRLKVIMDNTKRLTGGLAPGNRLTGDDELAQIDSLYHAMYDSLKVMRRRERAILENVADVVCSIDSNIRLTDINEAAQRHWGYVRDPLVGTRCAELIIDDDRDRAVESLRKAIEDAAEARFECGVKRKDGTTADTEWSATWSKEESSLYCVIHDISARKHLDRLKREFVAMVSHEIRTPLTSIQLTHQLLQVELGESLDAFSSKSLVAAQDNVNRLMALVNNLLDLDKLESGFIEFIANSILVKEVIDTSTGAIESLFRQKSLTVTALVDDDLRIYADEERLVQVLINLMANAIKYSPSNSELTIEAKPVGDFVKISVTDQGRGIPRDKLETVFERFRQVDASDEHVHKGIGLGLAISKAIVERHKGTIGVESIEGKGSTFWFTIPATESVYQSIELGSKSAS